MPSKHNQQAYRHPDYVALRRRVKAGGLICAMCNTRKATQVDHITPLVAGGQWTGENLRPACARCNAGEGARLGNRLRAKRRRYRNGKY